MTPCIVLLDMFKLRRRPKRLNIPIQLPQPLVQRRKPAPNILDIAFEMLHVHHIKSHNRRVQPNIRFRNLLAKVIRLRMLSEVFLRPRQSVKEREHSSLIRFLRRRKARSVNTVIYQIIRPLVRQIDFLPQGLRIQIHIPVLLGKQAVELGVEHANNIAALVAHDPFRFGVVQRRHGEAALVVRVDLEVDVAQVGESFVDGVRRHIFAGKVLVGRREAPAFFLHMPVHACDGDEGVEAFEFADDEGAVGPFGVSVELGMYHGCLIYLGLRTMDMRRRRRDDSGLSRAGIRRRVAWR